MTEEKVKSYLKRKHKRRVAIIKNTAFFLLVTAALFFMLNERFFHIEALSFHKAMHALGSGVKPYVPLKDGDASVSFIDVGQGDCELIRIKDRAILIDSGEEDYGDSVVGFLKYSGVERLDLVIVTHPHSDHYGGMYKVLQSFDVGELIMPELPDDKIPRGIVYEQLLEVLNDEKIPARYAKAGERFELSDDSYLEILTPLYYDYKDLNDFSITERFVYGDNSFLFTGDLQKFSELDLVESGADIKADVLKTGHHGSAGASCVEFLEAVSPRLAVFEAAEYNLYRHPRVDVIERLRNVGCNTSFSTANNGNIVMVTDGTDISVFTEKEQALIYQ